MRGCGNGGELPVPGRVGRGALLQAVRGSACALLIAALPAWVWSCSRSASGPAAGVSRTPVDVPPAIPSKTEPAGPLASEPTEAPDGEESIEARRARLMAELDGLKLATLGALSSAPPPLTVADGPASASPSTATPGPKAVVSIGAASVTGDVPNAARVVAGMRAGFRACFQRELERAPTSPGGDLVLALTLSSDGAVASAKASQVNGVPPEVASCLLARARAAAFQVNGGSAPTITFAIRLSRQ